MAKILFPILMFAFTHVASAQHVLKSIESKKTGESIVASCDEFKHDQCVLITIKHLNPIKNTEKLLFQIDPQKVSDSSSTVQEIIHQMESDQMMKNKYKVLGAYRKVCEMGWSRTKDRVNYNDMTGCILKTLFATAIFVPMGILPAAPGFALAAAAKSLAAGCVISSVALKDLSFVQFFLFYPALVTDVARLVTAYPIKKVVNKIQTRNLKRKIIPLLEEMSYEIKNPKELSDLDDENLYEQSEYRRSVISHRHFKKVLKYFSLNEVRI